MTEAGAFRRTFSSLRHRNYRLLWTGTLVSNSGDWMDIIALNWLVLELTHSPLALGLVNLCRGIPVLLITPLGGVACDKFERRRILMITQALAMVLAFLLGGLVTTEVVALWQIYLIAALRGIVMSFNQPARQTMISDVVPREDLTNAVALNSATIQLCKILGPATGGVLIALLGIDWLFYLNGLSFVAILYTLTLLPDLGTQKKTTSPWHDLVEGLRYIRNHDKLFYLVVLALVPMLFGMPYIAMLAVFAHQVLHVGPAGLGLMTSTAAVGALIGALGVAGRLRRPGIGMMVGSVVVFGLSLVAFAFSAWLPAALFFLFVAGFAQLTYNSANNGLIQILAEDAYRGRVVGMLTLNRGLVPLGTAITGFLAELLSPPVALALMASVVVVLGVAAWVLRPRGGL